MPGLAARILPYLKRFPWTSAGIAAGAVALGFSTVVFTLVLQETTWFPTGGPFHFWVLFWVFFLPWSLIFLTDWLISRRGPETRPSRAWRAALYTAVILSNLRQVSVYYAETFDATLGILPAALLYPAVGAGSFALAYRARERHHLYPALVGLLALYAPINYVTSSGGFTTDFRDASAFEAPVTDPGPPVFLLVFDELAYTELVRDGEVDAEAFPNLAALSRDGLWFTNATTNHGFTSESIPSILNGTIWSGAETRTLFQRLASRYRTVVIESDMEVEAWIRLNHGDEDRSIYRGKRSVLDSSPLLAASYVFKNLGHSPFWGDRRVKTLHNSPAIHVSAFREFDVLLEAAHRERAQGALTFWHCSLPHAPFLFDRDGRPHGRDAVSIGLGEDEPLPRDAMESYRKQAQLVDSLVGRFVARLKEQDLYDRSILILTADHGVRVWGRHEDFIDLAARIPFFVRAPGRAPATSDRDVQLIDTAPTLLDLLDHPVEESGFEGVSVFDTLPERRKKMFFRFGPNHYSPAPEPGTWVERVDDDE